MILLTNFQVFLILIISFPRNKFLFPVSVILHANWPIGGTRIKEQQVKTEVLYKAAYLLIDILWAKSQFSYDQNKL